MSSLYRSLLATYYDSNHYVAEDRHTANCIDCGVVCLICTATSNYYYASIVVAKCKVMTLCNNSV